MGRGNGSEYQKKFKEKISKILPGRPLALPWCTQFVSFRAAACVLEMRAKGQSLESLWWQESQLPTADRFSDIPVGPAPVFGPQARPPDGSIFEQLPATPGSRQGGIESDRSRPAGVPTQNRRCLLPDTAVVLRTNPSGRPCPNPRTPSRRRRTFMESPRRPWPPQPVAVANAIPTRKALGPWPATVPADARGQTHL